MNKSFSFPFKNSCILFAPSFVKKIGFGFIIFGFLSNPWFVGFIFCDDGEIGPVKIQAVIASFNLLLVVLGITLWWCSRKFSFTVPKNIFYSICMVGIVLFFILGMLEVYFTFVRPYKRNQFVHLGNRIYPIAGLTRPEHFTSDSTSGYALIPNIQDAEQMITTDRYGFRTTGRFYDPQKDSIIFVGDSTVFGWGVKDSATFEYQIAQNLDSSWNIINMGVPSYSLGHICSVLKQKAPFFRPKIVFVAILWPWKPFTDYGSPEAWRKIDFDFYRKTIPLRQTFNPRIAFGKKFIPKTFIAAKDLFFRIKYYRQIKENLMRPGIRDFTISPDDEKALALAHVEDLRQAAEGLEKIGAKVVFYVHPFQYTLFSEKYKSLGEMGRNILIEELSAYYPGDYLKENANGKILFIDGSHMTESGHALYAQYFLPIIRNQLK